MLQGPGKVGEIGQLAGQALQSLWNWSFGQVVAMFQMPFDTLPLWKQALFAVVVFALAHMSYKVINGIRKAMQSIVGSTVGLLSALISLLPQIAMAGLIAFGATWAILNLNPTWIPPGLR